MLLSCNTIIIGIYLRDHLRLKLNSNCIDTKPVR